MILFVIVILYNVCKVIIITLFKLVKIIYKNLQFNLIFIFWSYVKIALVSFYRLLKSLYKKFLSFFRYLGYSIWSFCNKMHKFVWYVEEFDKDLFKEATLYEENLHNVTELQEFYILGVMKEEDVYKGLEYLKALNSLKEGFGAYIERDDMFDRTYYSEDALEDKKSFYFLNIKFVQLNKKSEDMHYEHRYFQELNFKDVGKFLLNDFKPINYDLNFIEKYLNINTFMLRLNHFKFKIKALIKLLKVDVVSLFKEKIERLKEMFKIKLILKFLSDLFVEFKRIISFLRDYIKWMCNKGYWVNLKFLIELEWIKLKMKIANNVSHRVNVLRKNNKKVKLNNFYRSMHAKLEIYHEKNMATAIKFFYKVDCDRRADLWVEFYNYFSYWQYMPEDEKIRKRDRLIKRNLDYIKRKSKLINLQIAMSKAKRGEDIKDFFDKDGIIKGSLDMDDRIWEILKKDNLYRESLKKEKEIKEKNEKIS